MGTIVMQWLVAVVKRLCQINTLCDLMHYPGELLKQTAQNEKQSSLDLVVS